MQIRASGLAEAAFDLIPRLLLATYFAILVYTKSSALVRWFRATDPRTIGLADWVTKLPELGFIAFALATLILALVRRRRVIALPGLYPRIVALAGTFFLVIIGGLPHRADPSLALSLVASVLMLGGSIAATIIVMKLGRSYSLVPEARHLVTGGAYAYVRHPLYVAEEIFMLGLFLGFAAPWWYLALIAHIALQLERTRLEEIVLRDAFPEYAAYAARTARLIPGIF